jgi:hypothetical protein
MTCFATTLAEQGEHPVARRVAAAGPVLWIEEVRQRGHRRAECKKPFHSPLSFGLFARTRSAGQANDGCDELRGSISIPDRTSGDTAINTATVGERVG